jgi:hypothetical protein
LGGVRLAHAARENQYLSAGNLPTITPTTPDKEPFSAVEAIRKWPCFEFYGADKRERVHGLGSPLSNAEDRLVLRNLSVWFGNLWPGADRGEQRCFISPLAAVAESHAGRGSWRWWARYALPTLPGYGPPGPAVGVRPELARSTHTSWRGAYMKIPIQLIVVAVTGCATAPPPLPPAPEPIEVDPIALIEPFPFGVIWTAIPDLVIATEAGDSLVIANLFTRLDVIGRDTTGLRVDCSRCEPAVEGYVSEEEIIATHLPPEISAWGEFPEFLLSIRDAAAGRDLAALRPVMNPEFMFSFTGRQTPDAALAVWQSEGFRSLDEVPDLLDKGVISEDGRIWSAPPDFLMDPSYQGPRLGFRQRSDGRWEWLFLIRGAGHGR